MSLEENKALVRRFYEEVFKKNNLKAIEELVSPTFVDHSMPPGFPPGAEGVKQALSMYLAAFPDMAYTVDDMIADGEKVVTRYTMSGTHKGEMMGIAATGKKVTITGIEIMRIVGGKGVERWESWDEMGLMRQLGVIPATE